MLFVIGMVLKLLCYDLLEWHVTPAAMWYDGDYSFLEAGMRLLDFGVMIAFLGGGYYLMTGNANARDAGKIFAAAALALLFVFSTLEVNTFLYHYVPGFRAGGVSILWSIFALALITAGIWKNAAGPSLRGIGARLPSSPARCWCPILTVWISFIGSSPSLSSGRSC